MGLLPPVERNTEGDLPQGTDPVIPLEGIPIIQDSSGCPGRVA
jgi:hypothetical protein